MPGIFLNPHFKGFYFFIFIIILPCNKNYILYTPKVSDKVFVLQKEWTESYMTIIVLFGPVKNGTSLFFLTYLQMSIH